MSNLQPMIDNMNGAAAMMVANGHNVEDALERIASEYGYEYMDELINCWMKGMTIDGIGDGGCGFDTQTDWYEDNE